MAALMHQQVIFVFSHDSIGLGEDGPTHQPIEHITMLRATPNMQVWRPCDDAETVVAWRCALERHDGPSSLLLTRQAVAQQLRPSDILENIQKGGYVLYDNTQMETGIDIILIATGSEVDMCVQAARQLQGRIGVRVVSMPCCEVFDVQETAYKETVLPKTIVKRIAVEAGHPMSWRKYVLESGCMIGLNHYGASAPAKVLFEQYGFSIDNIIKKIREYHNDKECEYNQAN